MFWFLNLELPNGVICIVRFATRASTNKITTLVAKKSKAFI